MTGRFDGPARRVRDEADRAAERAVRDAQHAVLADLLGAYADGELPAESVARVEAHLVGCGRCRRDLAGQVALRDRLAAEPVLPAPPSLRDRIIAVTAAMPAPALNDVASASATVAAPAPSTSVSSDAVDAATVAPRRVRVPHVLTALAAVALVVLVALGGAALWRGRSEAAATNTPPVMARPEPAGGVPLLAAALLDYRRATAGDLPGRARDLDAVRAAVGFPVEPLHWADYRLLAAWTTTLDGEATAVLAYRRGDRLVVQYLVPEALFFRYSALRAAAAAHRPLAATDGAQAVLAWPEAASGALLVSDGTAEALAASLPPLSFAAPAAAPAGPEADVHP